MRERTDRDGYRFYFGVYVRNVGRFTPIYIARIDPFRKLPVYPSLLRTFARVGVKASPRTLGDSRRSAEGQRCVPACNVLQPVSRAVVGDTQGIVPRICDLHFGGSARGSNVVGEPVGTRIGEL